MALSAQSLFVAVSFLALTGNSAQTAALTTGKPANVYKKNTHVVNMPSPASASAVGSKEVTLSPEAVPNAPDEPPVCPSTNPESIRTLIRGIAREEGVDPDLADAIASVESGYGAVRRPSSAGAVGVMQLMPQTARELGVGDRCNVLANIQGGIRYIKLLQARYGDPILALAAYNAGPANIDRKRGIPEFAETENYIVRVLNRWRYAGKHFSESARALEATPPPLGETASHAWKDGHVIEVE